MEAVPQSLRTGEGKRTRLNSNKAVSHGQAEISLQANAKGNRLYSPTTVRRYLFCLWEVVRGPMKLLLMRSHPRISICGTSATDFASLKVEFIINALSRNRLIVVSFTTFTGGYIIEV